MQITWSRIATGLGGGTALVLMLAGCSALPGGHPTMMEGAAGPAFSESASPGVAEPGCPAGGPEVPEGAGAATTQDLDGDGAPDTLWLGSQAEKRVLGVTTASGARFSVPFTADSQTGTNPVSSDVGAGAVAGRLGDGSAVVLLDLGTEAKLYAVVDCAIVETLNEQGQQYRFDKGVTGFGTGAGCPVIGDKGRMLVGYLAKKKDGGRYTVTRTLIELSEGGARARNGAKQTVGASLAAEAAETVEANRFRCGPGGQAIEQAG